MWTALRPWLFPSVCAHCEVPGPALCSRCAPGPAQAVRFWVDGIPAFALGAYEGALRAAVVAMKRGERDALAALGDLLVRAPLAGVLVPVPTTRARAAERGFDQAVTLARRVAMVRGLPWAELLAKRGRAQEGRDRAARVQACGRFRIRHGVTALPSTVTLLDDVCTTGATLRDAAATLRREGVRVAGIAVLARTGPD